MDLREETTLALRNLWTSNEDRQNAKIVLFKAIAQATELTAKETDAIFFELDQLLLKEKEAGTTRPDPAT